MQQVHRVSFLAREIAAGVWTVKIDWNDDFQPAQEFGTFPTKAAAERWIEKDAIDWVKDHFATRH